MISEWLIYKRTHFHGCNEQTVFFPIIDNNVTYVSKGFEELKNLIANT